MEAFTLTFTQDRVTKNTIRYQEVTEGEEPAKIGQLYIQKSALGNSIPESLNVTVEAN